MVLRAGRRRQTRDEHSAQVLLQRVEVLEGTAKTDVRVGANPQDGRLDRSVRPMHFAQRISLDHIAGIIVHRVFAFADANDTHVILAQCAGQIDERLRSRGRGLAVQPFEQQERILGALQRFR